MVLEAEKGLPQPWSPSRTISLIWISVSTLEVDGGADKLSHGVFLLHLFECNGEQSHPKQGENIFQYQTSLSIRFSLIFVSHLLMPKTLVKHGVRGQC